jgi:hypothetical protein
MCDRKTHPTRGKQAYLTVSFSNRPLVVILFRLNSKERITLAFGAQTVRRHLCTRAAQLVEDEKVRGAAGDISPRLWKNTRLSLSDTYALTFQQNLAFKLSYRTHYL